ncbi:MAG: glycosyltransferase [Candidatus Terrybacteria bacterium]|nr:glycosyltransferase [Candidatus Terrybacteria bacterium]
MRIALLHDYLLRFGGAERVLQELVAIYPDAPVYTLFSDRSVTARYFPTAEIRTSILDRIPLLRSLHRFSLPALPFAVEAMDFRDYDAIISSSSAFVKGVVTRSQTVHLAYCHTPPRFLWEDRETYRRAHLPSLSAYAAAPLLHFLRLWDQQAAQRPDVLIANSRYTAERLLRWYRRDARVVSPPVDLSVRPLSEAVRRRFALPDEYFLSVGRLARWKQPELTLETFHRLGLPLFVVGDGPLAPSLRRSARRNVRLLGSQPDEIIRELMEGARGFLHPQREDFRITLVDDIAQGTPVVVFRSGGAEETVSEKVAGEFFDDLDPIAFADAVRRLRERWRRGDFIKERIRATVERYAPEHFREAMTQLVREATAHSRHIEERPKMTR